MRNIRIGNSITNQLAPVFRRVSRVHNQALEPFELRAVDAHILAALMGAGPLSVGEVSRELGLRGSTLTGALDRLEKRGLLKRELSPSDRRSWVLALGDLSARTSDGLSAALDAAERDCWGALTGAERRQLLKLLRKANEAFVATEDA